MTLDLLHELTNTEVFCLFHKLHVAIQTLWSQCLFPRAVWTNRWIVYFSQVSPCLHDLRQRFRLRLCLYLHVQQTLAHNSSQVSPCLQLCFWFLVGFVGSLHFPSNFRTQWTQFFHPIVFEGNLRRRSRWRIYFLVYNFTSFLLDSLRDTISWECVAKDDCVRSCLIELKSFLLSKFDVDPINRVLMYFPLFLLVPCKTWCFQVNVVRISVFFVHRIHRREKYRLSFAQILSSRDQSWIRDGV